MAHHLPPFLAAGALMPRAFVRNFAQHVPFKLIAAQDVITGYGDHQRRVSEMASGPRADSRFVIGQLAHRFIESLRGDEPVREIQFIGHSDRVWSGGRPGTEDEYKVSADRAQDAYEELMRAILRDPAGHVTWDQLAAAMRDGKLRRVLVGMGARQPLRLNPSGAAPENRRVEIKLLTKQSEPI